MAAKAALLIIDMLNRFDFPDADAVIAAAEHAAEAIERLRGEAAAAGIPVVFVNDNYGAWHLGTNKLVDELTEADTPGRAIAERLRPGADDYFVVKPEFSGFYATTLPALLPRLGVSRLILTGVAADICVLFTAADAHMREYPLWVPADAVAGITPERTHWALHIMRDTMTAAVSPTTELRLADWLAREE